MLNTDSRRRSAVGRISREDGEARLRPFKRPPTTRMLFVPRRQVALAVIATLGTARRAVAIGLLLVALARLVAAGALHQHAATLAVGDHRALGGLLALARGLLRHVELRTRLLDHLVAELLAQHARADLLDLALGHFAE